MPSLVYEPEPANVGVTARDASGQHPLIGLVSLLRDGRNAGARSVLKSLVEEGKAFAKTETGQHWCSMLKDSGLVKKGWILWNQANLDMVISGARASADNPFNMLQDLLSQIEEDDIEAYVRLLNDFAISAEMKETGEKERCND